MDIRIDHYVHHIEPSNGVAARLDQILNLLQLIVQKEDHMATELDTLTTTVSNAVRD